MAKPLFSIGIFADGQYADADDEVQQVEMFIDTAYHNHYRQTPKKLQQAVDYFVDQGVDAVIDLGDFIDRKPEDLGTVKSVTDQLTMPLWRALGNHDYYAFNADIDNLLKSYEMSSRYYSKDMGSYLFVVLDTNELGAVDLPEGSEEKEKAVARLMQQRKDGLIQAYSCNGGLGEKQLSWLRSQLDAAKSANKKVVVCAHDPVLPAGALNALNDKEIMDMIESYPNVVLYLCGHFHPGNYVAQNGVHYLTVPGMLEGDDNSYGIAHFYEDHIEIKGFGRLPDYNLTFNS